MPHTESVGFSALTGALIRPGLLAPPRPDVLPEPDSVLLLF